MWSWCWTRSTWKCRDSADEDIIDAAVKVYKNPSVYEYGNYLFDQDGTFIWSMLRRMWYNPAQMLAPDGTHDICNADGTYNPTGNGKREISCTYVVNNTLNDLGYHSFPSNFGNPNQYFCSVAWSDARAGDIVYIYDTSSRFTITHVAILANTPQEQPYTAGKYNFAFFTAQNFQVQIDYLFANVQSKTGLLYSVKDPMSLSSTKAEVWRPKVKVVDLRCVFPSEPKNVPIGQPIDPLILDLDGTGVQTISTYAGIHFDQDNNGFKESTAWVAPGDGILMLDKNGNGHLDNAGELFGDFMVLPDGTKASSGFEALKYFDANGDSKIDANDPIWSQLRIWQYDDAELYDWGVLDVGTSLAVGG